MKICIVKPVISKIQDVRVEKKIMRTADALSNIQGLSYMYFLNVI